MSLRELLRKIEDLSTSGDVDSLLDAEVSVRIHHANGQFNVVSNPQDVSIEHKFNNITKTEKDKITIDCGYIM